MDCVHLLLQPDDRGPLLFKQTNVLAVHLAGKVCLSLESLQCVHIAIAAQVVCDRLVPATHRNINMMYKELITR